MVQWAGSGGGLAGLPRCCLLAAPFEVPLGRELSMDGVKSVERREVVLVGLSNGGCHAE